MTKDWKKLETKYVAGDMSLADLAKKNKVSYSTLSKRASEGGWKAKRENFRAEAAKKALARAQARRQEQLEKLLDAAGSLAEEALEALQDKDQFRRYIVTEGTGEGCSVARERQFDKRDTKAMRDLAAVLNTLEPLLRGANEQSEGTSLRILLPEGEE